MRDLATLTVRTTLGEPFTGQDAAKLAVLIYRRFGRDASAAAAAWRRLLGNGCSTADFEWLTAAGFALETREVDADELSRELSEAG